VKISEFSARFPIAVIMLYITLAVLGIIGIKKIPLEFMPKMDMPFINILVSYPGTSPSEICENLAEKIEEAISTMSGIDKILTRCGPGRAEIGVILGTSARTEYQVLEVRERIEQIRNQLPEDLPPILVLKFDTDQWPIIFASIGVPEKKVHHSELLEQLVIRPLKTVEGVADVQFFGMEEKRVRVEIDQELLLNYRVSILEVYATLIANNLNLSLGGIEHLGKKYSVRLVGEFKKLEELRRLRIRPDLSLGDIARIDYEYIKPPFRGRVNLNPAFMMLVQKEAGANTVAVCRRVEKKLEEILSHPQLKGAEVKVWFNQEDEITRAVNSLRNSGLMGAVLAFFVLWFFLKNFRATFIISLAIPTSILISVSIMYFLGMSFNVISLSGLVCAIGMLVDNAIVVLEAIYARRERGEERFLSAVKGADEVGLAITASTTTTMIVFLPLIFSQHKEVSVLMGQLGLVVVITIGVSLLVSLTLIPLLANIWLTQDKSQKAQWFERIENWMISRLDFSLSHRKSVISGIFLLFAFSLSLFFIPKVIEKESIPKAMLHILQLNLSFDQKPGEEEIDEKLRVLEKLFFAHKEEWEVETVNALITPDFKRVSLVMKENRKRVKTVDALQEKVKELLDKEVNWPGVRLNFSTMAMGGPDQEVSPTTIKVKGDDPEQVFYFAEQLRERLKGLKSIKLVGELEKEGERELHIEIDRELAQKYGFDPSQVAFSIAYMVRGATVGKFTTEDKQIDLYLQLEEADRRTLSQLKDMTIKNSEGKPIPLKNIARFYIKGIPDRVLRENRRFTVKIPLFPAVKDLGIVRDEAMNALRDFRLPKGYIWVMGEEYQELIDMLYDLIVSMLLAMALVYIVMTMQFESFSLPFVVMFTIPLGAIGVGLTLALTRTTFNVLSGAGVLLLVGIVVNNAIVLVSHINNLRRQGIGERESLIKGAKDRLRPIAMTSMTTVIGLLPMALGLNDTGRMVYSPLALAVMGGMIASTFFTPLVIPLIYSVLDFLKKRISLLWGYPNQKPE